MKLTDTIYGIAYRNHRYSKDEHNVSLYSQEQDRDLALSCMAKAAKRLTFQFRPIDLINKEKHGTS